MINPEKQERLNKIIFLVFIVVLMTPLIVLTHCTPKSMVDEDNISLEQRLQPLPYVMTALYQQAKLIYQDKLPPYQYDQFNWRLSIKSFEFEIPVTKLSLSEVNQLISKRYEKQGWRMVSNDLTASLSSGQTMTWVKKQWLSEIRYVQYEDQEYWFITFRLLH